MNKYVRSLPNKAATSLAAYDGYGAIFDTDGVNVASAITNALVGVIQHGGASGENSEIIIMGEAPVRLGGTVAAGQRIGPHTDGTFVASADSGCQNAGIALEAGVAGDLINAFICPSNKTFA